MSTSIDIVSLLTIIFVMVDDWYIDKGQALVQSKPGAMPEFSDSEMLTLMLAQDFVPYPGETQYVGYTKVNTSASGIAWLALPLSKDVTTSCCNMRRATTTASGKFSLVYSFAMLKRSRFL